MTASPSCTLERVDWGDPRAVALHRMWDAEIADRYGVGEGRGPAALPAKRARALSVRHRDVVAHGGEGEVAGHIALLRRGIADLLLTEVEAGARRGGARRLVLQTGAQQPEAVALYETRGWTSTPAYEPYVETMPASLCVQKVFSD